MGALNFLDSLRGFLEKASSTVTPGTLIGVGVLFFILQFFLYYRRISGPLPGTTEWIGMEIEKPAFTFFTRRHRMAKKDIAPLAIITAVFSFLALFQLGDTSAPQTFFQFTNENSPLFIELDSPKELREFNRANRVSGIMFYTGMWTGSYRVEISADGKRWIELSPLDSSNAQAEPTPVMSQTHAQLFKWQFAEYKNDIHIAKFIRITASRFPIEIGEIALYTADGALIPSSSIVNTNAPELFDEQELIPIKPEYMNGMYFDEIYHGRTAFENLRGIRPYETTHPPLGKEIIASSIYVFGMTPFGWRFIGSVFGVAMLIVMYIFLKNMFGKTAVSVCGTLLFGFDFMRFVQTRIATIDTYGVFFILLSFFFMYRHITTDPDARFRKSLAPLALSGVAFGLGCASKWVVPYAGAGLALVYVIRLILLSKHYSKNGIGRFGKYLTKTLLFSVLFFAVVPVIIYCFSYVPIGYARDMTLGGGMLWDRKFYEMIWDNQVLMYNYHSGLVATHSYSSEWYQWIVNGRPILYFYSSTGNLRSSFAAFGNPVVWWGGFIAIIAMAIRFVRRRDGKSLFILIGYLSQLLPWVMVSRVVFIYHYFPSTLFLVIALAHVFDKILEQGRGRYRQAVYGFTATAGGLFGMFYPALSGVYAPHDYFRYVLRWIPGAWPFS